MSHKISTGTFYNNLVASRNLRPAINPLPVLPMEKPKKERVRSALELLAVLLVVGLLLLAMAIYGLTHMSN